MKKIFTIEYHVVMQIEFADELYERMLKQSLKLAMENVQPFIDRSETTVLEQSWKCHGIIETPELGDKP